MSERRLKQLVGALALAVLLWIVATLVSKGSGTIAATGEITRFLDGLDSGAVDGVRIEGPDGLVELERVGDAWTANGFPGDPMATDQLLGVLADLRIGDLIATNPDNHERMGVSADAATRVEFRVVGGPRSILLGHRGRAFGTAYVRMPDDDAVYLLHGDLLAQVIRRRDDWRDRTMVSVDTARVSRLTVERDGEAYALMRGDSAWSFDGGGAVNPTAVRGVLSELSSLIASGFLAESDSIAALERGGRTTAYSSEGEVLAEITVGAGSGDRWARTATNEYIYRVSSFRVGRVVPTRQSAQPAS